MKPLYYVLIEWKPVEADLLQWAEFFEDVEQRRVAWTRLENGIQVSTVFLGVDHRHFSDGPPILFETMSFAPGDGPSGLGDILDAGGRCCTWDEAEALHVRTVSELQQTLTPGDDQ